MLGNNYFQHKDYFSYVSKLHSGKIDELQVQIWLQDLDIVVPFTVKSIKAFFFKEAMGKVKHNMDFEALLIKFIETKGIVCIDEFDKIVKSKGNPNETHSAASDESVQNDLLPLLDGSEVDVGSKHSRRILNTRNILFVAAGAFSKSKVSDMVPEIQGRLPIKIKVDPLKKEDFLKILKNSKKSAVKLSSKLLKTEGLRLEFTEDALEQICLSADKLNQSHEYLGARQLIAVVDKVLEYVNFNAAELVEEYGKDGAALFFSN